MFLSVSMTIASQDDHYDALVSGALFDGVNTAAPDADGISVFKDFRNHADAVASILLYSAKETAFYPSSACGVHTQPEAFFNYLQKATSFPAFRYLGVEDEQYMLELRNGGSEQLLDQIAEKYYGREGVRVSRKLETDNAAREIREAFRKLVPKSIEDPGWRRWVLSLVTIYKPKDSDEITFDLAHVRLTISRDAVTGEAVIDPQVASLTKSSYLVMGRYISFYSDEIANFIEKATVNVFLRAMTTCNKEEEERETEVKFKPQRCKTRGEGPQRQSGTPRRTCGMNVQ
ncbi:hypothetical protein BGZ58_009207 [Dissophora ornata]|nr:hypothetical protein BGZ58_009207 [Dissophora ornata]